MDSDSNSECRLATASLVLYPRRAIISQYVYSSGWPTWGWEDEGYTLLPALALFVGRHQDLTGYVLPGEIYSPTSSSEFHLYEPRGAPNLHVLLRPTTRRDDYLD